MLAPGLARGCYATKALLPILLGNWLCDWVPMTWVCWRLGVLELDRRDNMGSSNLLFDACLALELGKLLGLVYPRVLLAVSVCTR